MEQTLARIRSQTSSPLAHQKTPASLLIALESTFKEQKTEASPTAYFAALLTTLDGTIQKRDLGLNEGDMLPAELYILALVAPYVPTPAIRANLSTIISLTSPIFPSLKSHAPVLRSQLSLYHVMFQSVDRSQLETQGIRQIFASILQLCLDPRPKVRKKAADIVKSVVASPPAPLAWHPYAERVAEWVHSALLDVNAGPLSRPKTGKTEASGAEMGIHILALLRPILPNLPPTFIPSIINTLLVLPRWGNPYLSQSAYSLLSDSFSLSAGDSSNHISGQMPDILKIVISSPPSKSDTVLSPAWVKVLGDTMLTLSTTDSDSCAAEILKVWEIVWNFLECDDLPTRRAAASSLDALCRCFTPALISSALQDEESKSTINKIIIRINEALDSLAYARSMPELLSVVSSIIIGLRHRPGSRKSPTAAESLLIPLVEHVGNMRSQKGFEYKEDVDATLATAMRILGPEVLLRILPLNLEPSDRKANREPRAYILPLLSLPHPSPLNHFISYFVPLSERMFNLQQNAENEGRSSEAKLWNVLVAQIWSGLVGYCSATVDLRQALTPAFSQLLSELLYSQPDLRPAILRSMKIMVESNVALSSPDNNQTPDSGSISPSEAADNVAFLQTQAESWLAVFFNLFGSVGRDGRAMVGDVISVWASISSKEDMTKIYSKVMDLFKNNLSGPARMPNQQGGNADSGSATAITQDILILLLPYLSPPDATTLFHLCSSTEVLGGKDNGVQKRGYKILTKLIESKKVTIDVETTLRQLDEISDGLVAAAKKDRFCLLSLLIPLIPPTAMHIIPSLIPEAVLGTKEPSEKARAAAFELILSMGNKMNKGGVVKRKMIDGMEEDGLDDAAANIEEFMTMVAGGLAGASPHMISATVTAISRLIFEFKDVISSKMHTEIFTTLLVFLSSANREIVKSILGFVKLAIHTLPADLIRPHLNQLVPALLGWSHDHKNHFKLKVRHIFERMLRRFEWEDVYSCAGEEEAAKVLVNIKKRKERAKRKKANGRHDDSDDNEVSTTKPTTGDAFEDVLYGSESELDDSEDEAQVIRSTGPSKKKAVEHGVRLRMDNDVPMDLLQGVASRLTSEGFDRRRKPGQDASHFKIHEDTGKMIIDDENSPDEEENKASSTNVAGTAYRESITSVDGFVRGANGQVKFNKDTKKRRHENAELEDIEMGEEDAIVNKSKKNKRKFDAKFGHEFKAKKAGGDVKKGGVDPYAYLPLSQAAKKGGRGRIGIVGKK